MSSTEQAARNPARAESRRNGPPGVRLPRLWLLVTLMMVGPCVLVQAPLEVGRWHLAAAVQARSEGNKELASQQLAKAMLWIPSSPLLYLQRAEWKLADGDREGALADTDKMLEISGKSAEGLIAHAAFMQSIGRHADAIADWKKINQISKQSGSPPRADALNGLA